MRLLYLTTFLLGHAHLETSSAMAQGTTDVDAVQRSSHTIRAFDWLRHVNVSLAYYSLRRYQAAIILDPPLLGKSLRFHATMMKRWGESKDADTVAVAVDQRTFGTWAKLEPGKPMAVVNIGRVKARGLRDLLTRDKPTGVCWFYVKDRLKDMVASGYLTDDRAQAAYEELKQFVEPALSQYDRYNWNPTPVGQVRVSGRRGWPDTSYAVTARTDPTTRHPHSLT